MAASPDPSAAPAGQPDLNDPEQLQQAVREVSLRLLAGGVPKQTMSQLQRTLRENVGDFPWQDVTQRILADPVDAQRLVQQGLAAQRDWIWRGGRETRGPSLGHRTKGFFAKICAQLIFLSIWTVILVATLLVLKHGFAWFDIYAALDWLYETFPSTRPQ